MTIPDNKSLKYTKNPCGWYKGMDKLETDKSKMYLISIERQDKNKLLLRLKTKNIECLASVEAIDAIGTQDLDLIENELKNNFIGHSYKEILNYDFGPKAGRL